MTKFSRLLDELTKPTQSYDKELFIESRAQQVIASATNLIKLINESYDEETANDLTKRLINSIKAEDESKFNRKIREIRKNKE